MPGSMLGDDLLPDAVQTRRRKLRSRVQGLREPIRQRRENLVPGPDVVGKAEDAAMSLRNKATSREGVLDRIRERRSSGSSGGGSQNTSSGSNNSGSSNGGSSEMV